MEYVSRISMIEQRAQAINLSLHGLCREAEVNFHHITRWRSGQVNPTVRVLERDLGKLERELTSREKQLFEWLREKVDLAS